MFNIFLLNASSLGATMYCCEQLHRYTKDSYLFKFTTLFKYSNFMYGLTVNQVIGQMMVVLAIITILMNYCRGGYRL